MENDMIERWGAKLDPRNVLTSEVKPTRERAPTAWNGTDEVGLVPSSGGAGGLCSRGRDLLLFDLEDRRQTGDAVCEMALWIYEWCRGGGDCLGVEFGGGGGVAGFLLEIVWGCWRWGCWCRGVLCGRRGRRGQRGMGSGNGIRRRMGRVSEWGVAVAPSVGMARGVVGVLFGGVVWAGAGGERGLLGHLLLVAPALHGTRLFDALTRNRRSFYVLVWLCHSI